MKPLNNPSFHQNQLNQSDIQAHVVDRVHACVQLANRSLSVDLALPAITFNQRGKIAGCARLQTNELRFNPVLLADNYQAFIDEVVPHEVAHLIAYALYGRVKPHGKEWQAIMRQVFGLNGHTYHKMDVTKVSGKRFTYQCLCGDIELSVRRHNKVLRQQQQYICRQCHQVLSFKPSSSV
ncbi:Protein SprT [Paraglaciecola mesophila]|uniref:Protein SprT n=1 Tax=Paraglaciecola mesophila TaxID=197222 RepID=A0A857JGQ6_9ALTE|nr:SprT family zinc-dependent metalloprotease [Paraglaciecola mesophila]QHJ10097.1 Protein SprT [Paraglaciecola mesophila]